MDICLKDDLRLENRRNLTQIGIHMPKSSESKINLDLFMRAGILKSEPMENLA
jgi:hypothetical protein